MCDAMRAQDYLKRIPFKLYSLADVAPKGSCIRELIATVGDAIRHDIEKSIELIEQLEELASPDAAKKE